MTHAKPPKRRERGTNLNKHVCDFLRKRIVSGELRPGEKISEDTIASEAGVSRTPVKLALLELAKEGFVDIEPRKGAYVKKYTNNDIIEICEIRETLEVLALKAAAVCINDEEVKSLDNILIEYEQIYEKFRNANQEDVLENNLFSLLWVKDYQFHVKLIESSKHGILIDLEKTKYFLLKSFFLIDLPSHEDLMNAIKEHRGILDALKKHNGELAGRLIQQHISKCKDFYKNYFRERENFSLLSLEKEQKG